MPVIDDLERKILAGGLTAMAGSMTALALALAALGWDHMTSSATLCGPAAAHCLACFGAVGCLAAALVAGAAAAWLLRPNRLCRVRS